MAYSGIVRTDVSFQREAVGETVRRHRPRLLFIASNVGSEDVLANLAAALEARGEILLVRAGLIGRIEAASPSGGRGYRYYPIR